MGGVREPDYQGFKGAALRHEASFILTSHGKILADNPEFNCE
jgi:riboflavin biosynthesis pyrimidine reductase